MRIKWENITIILLAVFALIVWLKAGPQILEFISTMLEVRPSGDPTDRTFGLMAFGLILVVLVAIVRILVSGGRDR
jgi:hypothetical protein